MFTEIFFDIETQKLFNEIGSQDPADLGVSIVSVYKRTVNELQQEIAGTMMSFWEHELPALWGHFQSVHRIVGFNTLRFDIPALARVAPANFAKMPHLDMMKHVRDTLGHSLSLNALATETLGTAKTDVGTNAVLYWKQHDAESLAKLKYYCEADVLLTRDLYDFGVKNKLLKYVDKWNTKREFPVDFSYPKKVVDASRQIGLF